MTAQGKIKTSYDFSPKMKNKLRRLKLDLQIRGVSGVSETAILEALIGGANIDHLEALLRR
jgi:hypothetical protein